MLRKAKQTLRKMTSSSYTELVEEQQQQQQQSRTATCEGESVDLLWNDAYDMNQDIDFLCTRLTLEEVQQLNDEYEYGGLELVHQHIVEQKAAVTAEAEQQQSQITQQNGTKNNPNTKADTATTWTAMELSTLVKAMKKYPTGGAGRWDAICNMINHTCALSVLRTRQECIDKYNTMLKKQQQRQQQQLPSTSTTTTTTDTVNSSSSTAANHMIRNSQTNGAIASTTTSTSTNGDCTKPSLLQAEQNDDISHNNNDDNKDIASGKTATSKTAAVTNTNNNNDGWTTEQDQLLQAALIQYPVTMEKNERWTCIASTIPGKNKKACVQRFKTIREMVVQQQQQTK
jgi:Myb-like DNA-binding domain